MRQFSQLDNDFVKNKFFKNYVEQKLINQYLP